MTRTASTSTFISRLGVRVRKTYQELDYAQRRMFEIRTGVPSMSARPRSNA